MKFDLGDVLTRMVKIGWKHKVLWLWQMLPGLLMIVFMPVMFLANPGFMMFMPEPYSQYANEPWVILVFMGLMFVLVIPSVFLGIIAQLTTTYGALKAEKGAEQLGFKELFQESLPYFWRVFGLYAIFIGTWMVVWFGFMIIFMAGSMITMGLASFCFMPIFFLLIPVLLVGYSILEFAQAAIIADDMKILDAIKHGWELFRANWLGIVIFTLILYFGMTVISSVLFMPMSLLPMVMMPFLMSAQGEPSVWMMIAFAGFFSLMIFVIYVVQGILMAFFQSAWAVLYLRLKGTANDATDMKVVMAEGQ